MPHWITDNAAALAAIAAVFSVLLTAAYLVATILIFKEARRSADSAAEAARTGKENAQAAQQSASAAQGSANAAAQSVILMREQMEEQANLGRSVVQTTIDTAAATIDHWKGLNVPSLIVSRIPNTDDLVPSRADSAVEHARRISQEVAAKLSSAFDDLRNARRVLETLRGVPYTDLRADSYNPACNHFESYLTSSLEKLMQVRGLVP